MRKPGKYVFISFAVLLLAALVVLTVILLKEEKIMWTRQNSLIPAEGPVVISDNGDINALVDAVDNSLRYFKRVSSRKRFVYGPDWVYSKQLVPSLEDFKEKLLEMGLTESFFKYIKENYKFYKSGASSVMFTGYYESTLNGSLEKTDTYCYPLYKEPDDLVDLDLSKFSFYKSGRGIPKSVKARVTDDKHVLPYYSRDEIDYHGKLEGRDLEIVWVDDPIDVFFLQIQGSGIVYMDNGEALRVNYADKNGHPYRAIGRYLIQIGAVAPENMSMQSIRKYLVAHPEKMKDVFNYNPSYVFFRKVDEGPIGNIGVPVTGMRSIATDYKLMPGGGLCYVETEIPLFDDDGNITEWKPFRGFVMNQDTGGAIKTPGRADFFTGHGKTSELIAGHMQQPGMFYFLIKK